MLICFESKKLEKQLSSPQNIKRSFGDQAKKIAARLADLSAAAHLAEMHTLPAARCHELTGDYAGCFAVNVSPNYRIIFRPTQQPPPHLPDGGIEWSAVDSITLLEITDYH